MNKLEDGNVFFLELRIASALRHALWMQNAKQGLESSDGKIARKAKRTWMRIVWMSCSRPSRLSQCDKLTLQWNLVWFHVVVDVLPCCMLQLSR